MITRQFHNISRDELSPVQTTVIIEVYGNEVVIRSIPKNVNILIANHNKDKVSLFNSESDEHEYKNVMNLHLGDVEKLQVEKLIYSHGYPKPLSMKKAFEEYTDECKHCKNFFVKGKVTMNRIYEEPYCERCNEDIEDALSGKYN